MSFIEKRIETRPESGEAPFDLDEVFFSRTDARGVIEAGNYVFRRVAGFEWDEMLGAPHKIIRHPDMPRGVFWLLWDRIKRGKVTGAYVKNRAQDGLYYWVYAVIAPYGEGYLSSRIKPSSALRATIEAEYTALREAEDRDGLSPEESAQHLLNRLGELGFPSYSAFQSHALSQELLSRDTELGIEPDARLSQLGDILAAADDLQEQTEQLTREFAAMRTIPHNMRVIASRLEPTGGPVSTLSKNYGAISQEMSEWFEDHVAGENSNFATIQGSANDSIFLEGTVRILKDCEDQLLNERRQLGEIAIESERAMLRRNVSAHVTHSKDGLAKVRDEADRIMRACSTMQRHVLGLSTTRVLCKIESGRIQTGGDGLEEIIRQLGTFQDRISHRLERIGENCRRILDFNTH